VLRPHHILNEEQKDLIGELGYKIVQDLEAFGADEPQVHMAFMEIIFVCSSRATETDKTVCIPYELLCQHAIPRP